MKKTLTFFILLFAFCIFCAFGAVSASAAAAADLTVEITAANGSSASVTLKDADSDGYYDIGTADELYAFAAAVNGGKPAINGELTKNVTVNADVMGSLTVDGATGEAIMKGDAILRAHVPIGNDDNRYSGYFTGNGYTLSGIYFKNPEAGYTGLFGFVYYGARVTDLTLTDSYICGGGSTGAIAGQCWGRIENCVSYATVVGGNYCVGGIVGSLDMDGWDGADRMWGCVNHGDVYGNEDVGGLVGNASNRAFIYYSYNTGDVYGTSRVGGLLGYTIGYIESSFSVGNVTVNGERAYVGIGYKEKEYKYIAYLSDTDTEDGGRTAEAFTSGAVTYYLNGNTSTPFGDKVLDWGQRLSGSNADPYPVYDPTPEHVVYSGGQCGAPTYSNDPVDYVIHDFTVDGNDANGICSCGALEEASKSTDKYDLDGDGTKDAVYEIGNAGQLLWFAETINGLSDDDTMIINAVLTASINLNPGYDFTFDADTGLVRILRGDNTVAFVGTGIAGAEGGNTVFDSTPSVIGACYASDQSAVSSDVDLSELRVWTTIANTSNYKLKNSIFDGRGYTVSGLFTLQESDYVGLFGEIAAATVKNVTVTRSLLYGANSVGGVVGYADADCVVENCHSTATVLNTAFYTGGVVGSNYGTVTGSSHTGTVSGTNDVGGVIGSNRGTVKGSSHTGTVSGTNDVGGVIGSNRGTVTGSSHTGTVSGTDNVGGVAGTNADTVTDCSNTGTVSGTNDSIGGVVGYNYGTVKDSSNTGTVSGTYRVGGVVGTSLEAGTVTGCSNTGNVSGTDVVGGVVGDNYGTVTNCYNTGNVSGTENVGGVVGHNPDGTVQNCYNTGNVSGEIYVGGVVSYNPDGTVRNCYYLTGTAAGGINGADAAAQAEVKTAAQFASGEVAHLLGSAWGQNMDNGKENEGYPALGGAVVYYGYLSCADGAVMLYTNDSTASKTKPTHISEKAENKASCKAAAVCDTCGESYGEVDKANHDVNVTYENGFCPHCDAYQPATLHNNGTENDTTDDYYEIANAGQLYWFAAQVDSGNNEINVALTANIVVNKNVLVDGELNPDANAVSGFRQWTAIGTYSWSPSRFIDYRYQGTFDGKGHTVSGLYYNVVPARASVGFFSYLAEGGTVQNVGIIDSYFYGGTGIAGIVARNMGGTVKSCYNGGRIDGGTNDWVGGIVGSNEAGGTVINCYNVGKVSGDSGFGGVVGSLSSGTVLNCYYLASAETDSIDGTLFKTSAQFASGEVAYLLNLNDGEDALVWGQTIGTDSYPIPGGDKVYYGYTTCDAAEAAPVYSNVSTVAAEKPTHTMATATCTAPSACTVCGHTEGEALGHKYDNACDTACNICSETRTVAAHLDADENELCDVCNAELPREGLSGGAVAGIVIAAVAVVGLGVFVLFWFVIKKKKWSDLVGIFKK